MEPNRRTFLIQSGATVGVVGLGYLLWDRRAPAGGPGDTGKPPVARQPSGLVKEALQRMKAENKPGIAVRIPADPRLRHWPGHLLIGLLNDYDQRDFGLFAESVYVCLEGPALQAGIRGADPSHALVLFDASGRAVAGVPFDYQLEDAWEKFAPLLTSLLHGEGDGRLRARAESARRRADPGVIEAVDRLSTEADHDLAVRHARTIGPLLVFEHLNAIDVAREQALERVIRQYVQTASGTSPGPRLPFGVEAEKFKGGCGGDFCEEQPKSTMRLGGACGMAIVGPDARSFLRYLSS